jgi:hypothetical protein
MESSAFKQTGVAMQNQDVMQNNFDIIAAVQSTPSDVPRSVWVWPLLNAAK